MTELRVAQERVEFQPAQKVTDDASVLTLKNLVLEPLCRWQDGLALPGLFDHWECTDGGRNWRFFIRTGARFHDGKPCEAGDVIAFIQRIIRSVDAFGMKWSYGRYLADTVFTAEGRSCVRATNPEPFADILDVFTEFFPCREDRAGRAVIGTGPFRVADYQPGSRVDLERVSGTQAPARLAISADPEAAGRYRALKEGEADLAVQLERMEQPIDYDPAYQWRKTTSTMSVIYYLNCASGVFAAPPARLAVNHAVDVQPIIRDLFQGLGTPASTIVSPHHLGYGAARIGPIAFDREKAKSLLDRTRFDGEVVMRTPTSMPEKAVQITEAVQESLFAVGLKARIEVQPDRPGFAREVGRKEIGDMAIFDSSPHSTFRILNDKISSSVKAVWWQGYHDGAVEELIAAAGLAVSGAERERAYGKCLARLNANPPWLYLFHPVGVAACRKTVGNVELDPKGILVIR